MGQVKMSHTPSAAPSALLVQDYQTGIVQSLPDVDVDQLLTQVDTAIGDARSQGAVVAWVRTALTDPDFEAIPLHGLMAGMATPPQRPHLHADSDTTRIDDRLTPRPGDLVWFARRASALFRRAHWTSGFENVGSRRSSLRASSRAVRYSPRCAKPSIWTIRSQCSETSAPTETRKFTHS